MNDRCRLFPDRSVRMKDLTTGSINVHIFALASPYVAALLTQVAYQFVDLYFVARLGSQATAGVNAAGNALFVSAALAQVVTVGTTPLVAHAVGRKDRAGANAIFNQSLLLSAVLGALMILLLAALTPAYMNSIAADAATAEAGVAFTLWMLPGIAATFPMAALGAALRAIGVVRPTIAITTLTVLINAALAPVLIGGWGTQHPLGVIGAGLASSISALLGVAILARYFCKARGYLRIRRDLLRPRPAQWRGFIAVGLPASFEFILTFLSTTLVYYTIRDFGSAAQAGFSIGSRILQIILVPGLAIGFAASPIAAQNFGAGNAERVRETFYRTALLGGAVMAVLALIAQWWSSALTSVFDADAVALSIAAMFLQAMSWNFVAQSVAYACSNMFQGLGNTMPLLLSAGVRFVVFCTCALWLGTRPNFELEQVWHLLTAAIYAQAVVSMWLLTIEFRRRLPPGEDKRLSGQPERN
jgi:MATE family, multidrug efflux pump